jgi:hypothetical protein
MQLNFEHKTAGHCENGVVRNLLKYYEVDLSEPMILGLGSGLFFSHMPFYKMHGMPITSFRPLPGAIFRCDQGSQVKSSGLIRPDKAMVKLDETFFVRSVGLLVGVVNLLTFQRVPVPF